MGDDDYEIAYVLAGRETPPPQTIRMMMDSPRTTPVYARQYEDKYAVLYYICGLTGCKVEFDRRVTEDVSSTVARLRPALPLLNEMRIYLTSNPPFAHAARSAAIACEIIDFVGGTRLPNQNPAVVCARYRLLDAEKDMLAFAYTRVNQTMDIIRNIVTTAYRKGRPVNTQTPRKRVRLDFDESQQVRSTRECLWCSAGFTSLLVYLGVDKNTVVCEVCMPGHKEVRRRLEAFQQATARLLSKFQCVSSDTGAARVDAPDRESPAVLAPPRTLLSPPPRAYVYE